MPDGSLAWLRADWPAPSNVEAWVTTRQGGYSQGPFASLNLGTRAGDEPASVAANRRVLDGAFGWSKPVQWLRQTHGTQVVEARADGAERDGDSVYTRQTGQPCAVLTADCLPVLLAGVHGEFVAVAHAGWRGLAAGVVERTVAAAPGELMAWLGPAISRAHFEVGDEVRTDFVERDAEAASAFQPSEYGAGRWLADLYALARLRLRRCGVERIYGGGLCTYADEARFFSYRRDGQSGRMASVIWLTA